MLQIDKQHVWLMEWATEWVTGSGQVNEWTYERMAAWMDGWIGRMGIEWVSVWGGEGLRGWVVIECGAMAINVMFMLTLGPTTSQGSQIPGDGSWNQIQIQIQDHKLLSITLHATAPVFIYAVIVDVSPLASFCPFFIFGTRIGWLQLHLGHVSCSVLRRWWSRCATDRVAYLSGDCGNCTLDSHIIVPINGCTMAMGGQERA